MRGWLRGLGGGADGRVGAGASRAGDQELHSPAVWQPGTWCQWQRSCFPRDEAINPKSGLENILFYAQE